MILSILMPALANRDWVRLASKLKAQCDREGRCELLTVVDGGAITSGAKRQALAEMARGDYLACVDDDDDVSPNYVSSLVAACGSGCDVVTFDLEMTNAGQSKHRQSFSVAHRDGGQSANGKRAMTANHLCAWRRDIARLVAWDTALGYADDQLWYKPLIEAHSDLTEMHIDEELYYYRYHPATTANQQSGRVMYSKARYAGGCGVFVLNGEPVLSTAGMTRYAATGLVEVRDNRNVQRVVPVAEMAHVATVAIV